MPLHAWLFEFATLYDAPLLDLSLTMAISMCLTLLAMSLPPLSASMGGPRPRLPPCITRHTHALFPVCTHTVRHL